MVEYVLGTVLLIVYLWDGIWGMGHGMRGDMGLGMVEQVSGMVFLYLRDGVWGMRYMEHGTCDIGYGMIWDLGR